MISNGNAQANQIEELGSRVGGLSVNRPKQKRATRKFQDFGLGNDSISPSPAPEQSTSIGPHVNALDPAASNLVNDTQPNTNTATDENDLLLLSYRYMEQFQYLTPKKDGTLPSFFTFENAAPPTAGTQFHSVDQGTASSKFIRSSMYFVPESETLRKATKLPMSVTIRPFAPVLECEEHIPVIDMSELGAGNETDVLDVGPPRCRRCRTYINPLMQFTSINTFTCNVCQFPKNTVPVEYQSYLDAQGYRTDKLSRPELHKGVYDIIVPKEYNVGGPEHLPSSLHHIFLIDISERSLKQNLPMLIADAIRATLYGDVETENETLKSTDPNATQKFAIMMFDKRIHYFNLSHKLDSVQVTVMPDLDDPFVPFIDGLFADPEESRLMIEGALNHLEQICLQEGNVVDAEPCFAVACRAAMLALEMVGGGKITSVLTSIPSWGPGRLVYKDHKAVGRATNPEIEKGVFLPDNEYYKLLGRDFISNNIGLDCLVVSPTSVDLSNIGWLCAISGGFVRKWSSFEIDRDSRDFSGNFVNSVKKMRGYQGQLKLRCSNGLQVTQYYGAYSAVSDLSVVGSVQDPSIPVISEDKSITVLLSYDGKLNTNYDCHFQAAMLYTDLVGVRKVRVINLVLAVAERLEDVFNLTDQDSVVATIVRDTISFIGKQPITELRDSVNEKLVDVFTQYRAMSEMGHNMNRTLSNQLLFPEKLKNLPLYLLSFIKSRPLRTSGASSDSRLVDIYLMLNEPLVKLLYGLYPALVELHSLEDHEALYDEHYDFLRLPRFKDLSAKNMDYGAYILCDACTVYFIIHPNANILLVKDLFGEQVESVEEIDPLMDRLPQLDTHISLQTRNLISYFHSNIIGSPKLTSDVIHIIRQGIDNDTILQEKFLEDSLQGKMVTTNWPSYAEYITSLHKAIRVKLDNDKSSNRVRQSVTATEHDETLAQKLIHF
ncbi:uncharacterized protein PRCAT00001326001 [Priceomyces carsonii]|uniref:uncharacterized protein n=1 Tax=Priceomyces carsonii TaxID=28549 RepID=UPI002EDB3107|nr:unnamed protein product [Priceomyces carsonii]